MKYLDFEISFQVLCLLALTIVDVLYKNIEKDDNHTLSYTIVSVL